MLAHLRESHAQFAVVVDENGGAEGIVSFEDVLTEVFGEFADEFKAGQPQPEKLPDGRVRLPGLLLLDEAAAWTGVTWKGQADTVGGHVFFTLGHVPAPGERVTIEGVEVEVEKMDGLAIASVLVKPKPQNPEASPKVVDLPKS